MTGSGLPVDELDGGGLLRFIYTCPLGLILTDKRGDIRILNGTATGQLMPFCQSGMIQNLFEVVESWNPVFAQSLRQLIGAANHEVVVDRLQLARDRQSSYYVQLHVQPFDGGLSAVCHDVTTVVAQEAEVLHLATEEASQRGRAELAAGILHDMGNALTGIGSQAVAVRGLVNRSTDVIANIERLVRALTVKQDGLDVALGPGKGRKLVDLLRAIHSASVRDQRETQQVLDALHTYVSHAQELLSINRNYAEGSIAVARAELKQLISDIRNMTRSSFTKRDGTLSIDTPDEELVLDIDRSKLLQILLNLLKNSVEAWDSTESETLQVHMRVGFAADGGLEFAIKDNGCGFEPKQAESYFARDASTKWRSSGLGLYSCRRLAVSLGGSLRLFSPGPGRGAEALLYLPAETIHRDGDN